MKRSLVVFFSLVLVVLMAATACNPNSNPTSTISSQASASVAKSEDTSEAPIITASSIRMLTHYDRTEERAEAVAFFEVIDGFQEESDIEVEIETIPWDQLESKTVITNSAGNPPDLSTCGSQNMSIMVKAGALLALDDYYAETYTDEDLDDFYPAGLDLGVSVVDGKRYIAMNAIMAKHLIYNKEIIPKAPETWDELMQMTINARDKDKNIYGMIIPATIPNALANYLYPIVYGMGYDVIDSKDTSAAFNNDGVKYAIKYYAEMLQKEGLPTSTFTGAFNDLNQLFMNGTIGACFNRNFAFETTEWGKRGSLGFAPLPGIKKGENAPAVVQGWATAIPAKAENPNEAWLLIKYMQSPDPCAIYATGQGTIPLRKSVSDRPEFQSDYYEFLFNLLNTPGATKPLVSMLYAADQEKALTDVFVEYALDPTKNLDEMLAKAQEDVNKKNFPN